MTRPLPPELDQPAWLHGHTAFTTIRTVQGQPQLWAPHLTRLADTCALLGLPSPDPAPPPCPAAPWGLLRLTVSAAGTHHSWRPLTPPPPSAAVWLTDWQVHPQLGAHKTGNYLPYRLALQEAQAHGAAEGLLQDHSGAVVDGSRSALLLQLDGQLCRPAGGLPSVTRAAYLAELGLDPAPRRVSVPDLQRAEAAWLCGAGLGILPVHALAGEGWVRTVQTRAAGTAHPALIVPT